MNQPIQAPKGPMKPPQGAHDAILGAPEAVNRLQYLANWLPTRGVALFVLLVAGLLIMTPSITAQPSQASSDQAWSEVSSSLNSIVFSATDMLTTTIVHSPAQNPPRIEGHHIHQDAQEALPGETAKTEWTFHKTSDNAHPDGNEQQMLWLMNRARANPTQEGIWLATTNEENIDVVREYFGVDIEVLQNEFAGYEAKPPAAFDVRLYHAAKAHSDDLISRDAQDHDGQFDRVREAGFSCAGARLNVYSYSQGSIFGHAGFNIDWGPGTPDGMQSSRGHRKAVMSLDGRYSNVGIAMVSEDDPKTRVGPLVTTGNYCRARNRNNHYNRFLVGTVWQDHNRNSSYDQGEGVSNVTVTPNRGTYYAVTSQSGGYAIPLTSSGTYDVTFSGSVNTVQTVKVDDDSVLLYFQVPATYSISGQVKDGDGNAIANVAITIKNGDFMTTTNRNGEYRFDNLPEGVYTLVPSQSNYIFSPTTLTVTVGPNATRKNFLGKRRTFAFKTAAYQTISLQRGSSLIIEGQNFPANREVTIMVNGNHQLGTITSNTIGYFAFLLKTDQAQAGHYTLKAITDDEVIMSFNLYETGTLMQDVAPSSPVMNMPPDIALDHFYHLPIIFHADSE